MKLVSRVGRERFLGAGRFIAELEIGIVGVVFSRDVWIKGGRQEDRHRNRRGKQKVLPAPFEFDVHKVENDVHGFRDRN